MPTFVKNDSRNIFGVHEEKLKEVTIQPMSQEQIDLCNKEQLERKRCFQNSYNIVMNNPERFSYVLGVANFGISFEHAFIKDLETGEYIDPTGYLLLEHVEPEQMLVIRDFNAEELASFVLSQGNESYPPDFDTMSKMNLNMELFVSAQEYFRSKREIINNFEP